MFVALNHMLIRLTNTEIDPALDWPQPIFAIGVMIAPQKRRRRKRQCRTQPDSYGQETLLYLFRPHKQPSLGRGGIAMAVPGASEVAPSGTPITGAPSRERNRESAPSSGFA
jgi:hypothetical protein